MRDRLRHEPGRLLGRLVTSPAAFALAALVDLTGYALTNLSARWAPGRGSWRAR